MANIIIPPKWAIVPSRETTPEEVFLSRRSFIQKAGVAALTIGGGLTACSHSGEEASAQESSAAPPPEPAPGLYPATRNDQFKLDRPLTGEEIAATHNNFYEFANSQSHGPSFQQMVKQESEGYAFRPWEIEIGGLCESPRTMTIDEIEKVAPLEERLYRFRCVETWAMAVPWTGYPFSKLLEVVKPKPEAKYVRFVSWLDKEIKGVKDTPWYEWPYYEGLRMDEAMNEVTLLCTGIYGHALTPSHGPPARIIVPWKYGYKNIKSIVKIELVEEQPPTFWNDLQPNEYGFYSNVNPEVPHPRWSQAHEWMIPDKSVRRPTMLYNGYGEYVAGLYA